MRQRGVAFVAADPPVLIAKHDYGAQIVRVLEQVFVCSQRPFDEGRTYREPPWSLQTQSASVRLSGDGSAEIRSAHGSRSYHSSVPYSTCITPERYHADVARCILEALGERSDDIPKLLGLSR